jgi:hypothetical protein
MKKAKDKKIDVPVITANMVPLTKGEAALVFRKGMKCVLVTPQATGRVADSVLLATALASLLRAGDDMLADVINLELARMVAFVNGLDVGMQDRTSKTKPTKEIKRRGRPPKKGK